MGINFVYGDSESKSKATYFSLNPTIGRINSAIDYTIYLNSLVKYTVDYLRESIDSVDKCEKWFDVVSNGHAVDCKLHEFKYAIEKVGNLTINQDIFNKLLKNRFCEVLVLGYQFKQKSQERLKKLIEEEKEFRKEINDRGTDIIYRG